jgi:SAM-dependent methyltransferase
MERCLDVACGSGQLTKALAPHFKFVDAIDRSAAQLAQAAPLPNATYSCVTDASDLSQHFRDNSMDCVTVAQAFHWMEATPTLQEFSRVLRPGGTLAVLGYGVCHVDLEPTQRAFKTYYEDTLGTRFDFPSDPRCLWECDRIRLDSAHETDTFSPPFDAVQRLWFPHTNEVTAGDFLDYLRTMSAYQKLSDKQGALRPILDSFQGDLNRALKVTFPFWLILARKPHGGGAVK